MAVDYRGFTSYRQCNNEKGRMSAAPVYLLLI